MYCYYDGCRVRLTLQVHYILTYFVCQRYQKYKKCILSSPKKISDGMSMYLC